MDVVDTLRHQRELVNRELDAPQREAELIARLKAIYHDQGIEVPDHILKQGVDALAESRFTYTPPAPNWKTRLARIYVSRGRWGRPVGAAALACLVMIAGYFFVYRPLVDHQVEAARIELAETLPARMDSLYQSIYTETKVQAALAQAEPWVARGKAAAAREDREAALTAIDHLQAIHDTLLLEYTLRIVDREGENTGVWTFPEVNIDATNYYIVVEAVGPDGEILTVPVTNEETGLIEEVELWAQRVPEATYDAVRADRLDDGIIQRNIMGVKQYGFIDTEFTMPALDGAITQW